MNDTPNLDKAAHYMRECFATINQALDAGEITKDQWRGFLYALPMDWWEGKASGGFDSATRRHVSRLLRED